MVTTMKDFNRNRVVHLKQIHSDPLIKMKKYADAYTSLGPGIDQNGRPATGLTEDYVTQGPKGGKVSHLGTRRFMEKELDLEDGVLKSSSKYWIQYNVRVGAEPIRLDLTDSYDLLKYLMVIAQSNVADGYKEVEKNSKVEYVIYSEEQEAAEKVLSRRSLKDAYLVSDKLDLETKINILAVYGYIADATNINTIDSKIDDKIEENPEEFLTLVEDDMLIQRSLITKALDKGILTISEGKIMHGEVAVGYDKDNATAVIAKDLTLQAIIKAKLSGDMDLIKAALDNRTEIK